MKSHGIEVKRAHEPAAPSDGYRVLVDRMWPRGVRKEVLQVEEWNKEVAPSAELRHWFGHEEERWEEFKRRYYAELDAAPEAWRPLVEAARHNRVTLVYAAKDEEHNNAVALEAYLRLKLNVPGHGVWHAAAQEE